MYLEGRWRLLTARDVPADPVEALDVSLLQGRALRPLLGIDGGGSRTTGPLLVYTKKNTTDWLFHPVGAPEDSTSAKLLRGWLKARQSSGAIKLRLAYRYTNDGVTFDAASPLYTAGTKEQTNDGDTFGETFVDVSGGTPRSLIQPGVEAINSSGSSLEIAAVTVRFDRKPS